MRKQISLLSILLLSIFHPTNIAYAADGDNATFSFEPLNGKSGENEVKLVVNTDNAAINHLIFDIKDDATLTFDITGSGDPISFPLNGQSVLGTETPFTTVSGDQGYDLASANPANTSAYSALHFATLITDQNLPSGAGGTLEYDTDTAVYVNTVRKGIFSGTYTVLANQAPVISSPTVDSTSLSSSTTAPSSGTPTPTNLVQNIPVTANFTFEVTDSTDASVNKTMKIYKRLDDGSWNYPASADLTITQSRSGTDMTFGYTLSSGQALDYASYYKIEYIATDDQGASDTETYYFSTEADDNAPSEIAKAFMTFNSDSSTRSEIISQISFTTSTDNNDISAYYLWSKEYLEAKNIIDSNGDRHTSLDTNGNSTVSDEEFFVGLRNVINGNDYVSKLTKAEAGSTPYFRITGTKVDSYDDNSTTGTTNDDKYYINESLEEDILYIVAADTAQDISGNDVPNFSPFKVVNKIGDIFGAEVQIGDRDYITGDGSLDVWDSVFLYRNIIGLQDEHPMIAPDMVHSTKYNYESNTSTSGTSAAY